MKNLLLLALLLPSLAWSAANSLLFTQRSAADDGNLTRVVTCATGPCLLQYDTGSQLPSFLTLGTNLSITSGVLNAASSGQVQSDWTASSGAAFILHKPSLATVATSGAYSDLTGIPSTFAPSAHTQAFSTITSTPTTLSGYGITDGVTATALTTTLSSYVTSSALTTALSSYATSATVTSGLAGKFNTPGGTTAQYLRGDGTAATFPTAVSSFTNDAGYLTSVSSGQVTTALGFTPVSQAGARTAISLTTTGTSGAATYNNSTGVLNVPNYAPGTGTVTSVVAGTGLSGGTITTSGTISLPNTGTAGSYSGVTTDAQGRVSAGTARSFSYTTRALNTCFQVSSTRDAQVSYVVEIATTSTLTSGQQGTVFFEISDDSSCIVNTQEVVRFTNANSQSLGLTVTMVQTVSGALPGIVPAAKYAKLRTQNVTGTPTFTAHPGQETLM